MTTGVRSTRGKRQVERPAVEALISVDPDAPLSPTAKRILTAARRLVVKGGYAALSLQAVADEAGEQKSTIAYHFGDKAGLVASLLESLIHDGNRRSLGDLRRITDEPQRVSALIAAQVKIAEDSTYWRLLFALLPEIVKDKKLNAKFAQLMRWYWEVDLRCLGLRLDTEVRAELDRLASLYLAVLEGFALQRQLIGAEFDTKAHFATWEEVIVPYMTRLMTERPELMEQPQGESVTAASSLPQSPG
jgi:AcrR family transcriptional regulator